MPFDEDDGRIWRPGVEEPKFSGGGVTRLRWHFDWRSYLLGIATVFGVILLAVFLVAIPLSEREAVVSDPADWVSVAGPSLEGGTLSYSDHVPNDVSPRINFYQRDEDAKPWKCICLPPPEGPIYITGINAGTGIYGFGGPDSDEVDSLGFIAGGHEFIRCTLVEDEMPDITFKVHDPDNYCFYHDHEAESRVYVGLEEHGPICAEAAEELAGPLELKDERSD